MKKSNRAKRIEPKIKADNNEHGLVNAGLNLEHKTGKVIPVCIAGDTLIDSKGVKEVDMPSDIKIMMDSLTDQQAVKFARTMRILADAAELFASARLSTSLRKRPPPWRWRGPEEK